jgi:predicted membrane-bound spermidine synthase
MNDLLETFRVVDGYDRSKTPREITVRKFTLDDIERLETGRGEVLILDRHGKARRARLNGGLKRWKRDATRFEQSFSYGMYEHFRLTTQEMLDQLVVEV